MEWIDILKPIQNTVEMVKLRDWLKEERKTKSILPAGKDTFNAFMLCPYEKTRLVVIGQDPYPNSEHAHGLAFSSLSDEMPQSLRNVFNEVYDNLYADSGLTKRQCFPTNNLTSWAKQGVLLINTTLTVEEGESGSHIGRWDYFTERIMTELDKHANNLIFLLWGQKAKAWKKFIKNDKHAILESSHPSPLSFEKGFKGCGHFKQINEIIEKDFIKTAQKRMLDVGKANEMSEVFGKYLLEHGINIEYSELCQVMNFYIGAFPRYIGTIVPEVNELFNINFKTKENHE